ncbi:hypothetical protein AUP68_15229 [Ilyonectria robusta]
MARHLLQKGCFETRRASIMPPETLLSLIWPDLNRWKGQFGPTPSQINNFVTMGLTNLLFCLREVILQDSVFLIKKFPRSPVWNHPVFQNKAYLLFAEEVSSLVQKRARGQAS